MPPTPKPQPTLALTGRRHAILTKPQKLYPRPTFAAGAVLWRNRGTSIELAVAHRPHYDDWSLPKGKTDAGEALPVTAAREIAEETGYTARLGQLLGHVTYPVGSRTKVVYYWAAEATAGAFHPNDEVDELRWLPPTDAAAVLTYDADRAVVEAALRHLTPCLHAAHTARVLYVRHARAGDRREWVGEDDLRPLDDKGMLQAQLLVPMLRTYQPTRVLSALPDRCQATAAPLADALGLSVRVDPLLGDAGWVDSPAAARRASMEVVAMGGVSVVVAQGTVIPALVEELLGDGVPAKKASTWVLDFADSRLTSAGYLASPLPIL